MFCIVLYYFTDPACQDINTHDHCYVSDPSCPSHLDSSSTSNVLYTQTEFTEEVHSSSLSVFVSSPQAPIENTSNADVVFVVCALIYVAIFLIVVVWYRLRKNLRKKDRLIRGKIENCPTMLRTFLGLLFKEFKY